MISDDDSEFEDVTNRKKPSFSSSKPCGFEATVPMKQSNSVVNKAHVERIDGINIFSIENIIF